MRTKRDLAQLPLLREEPSLRQPPSTRYQGSKLKLLEWIWQNLQHVEFNTALDAFGGTGSIAYLLKAHGKEVTYNDHLRFNHLIGTALIENSHVELSLENVASILTRDPNHTYDDLIATLFGGIYFTNDENLWLDLICQNIARLSGKYKRALAYYALFQSCIVKRPYNLFHRKNLYMRLASVERSFGNKATWDTPFGDHFQQFVAEANASVFDSGFRCRATCSDATEIPGQFDLVYLDPPYVSSKGTTVDYRDFYHFLEGLVIYPRWRAEIDYSRKHLPLKGDRSRWSDPKRITDAFKNCFERYADSTIVLSYGNKGIPSVEEIVALLKHYKSEVIVTEQPNYKYALSIDSSTKEMLFIAR
ncbi:MAG: DNA adenine methylase [Candidatus Binataceae bacterium]|nr:DNA adenine methylase [Candidatus Binataceae bacterium]